MKFNFTFLALVCAVMCFAQPANDDCANAIPITMGGPEICIPTAGDNTDATNSGIAPPCAFYQGGDLWYTVVVPSTGIAIIEMTDNGGFTDGGMAVYTGTCDALVELECDDDDGEGTYPKVDLTGLTPGEQLFIAVWEYGNNAFGPFNICAYQPPTCPDIEPATFVVDSVAEDFVTLSWESFSAGSTYMLEYGPQGYAYGTGTEITGITGTDGPPVTIDGLDLFTFYDFYLTAVCGANDQTDTIMQTVNTLPGPLLNDDCEGAINLPVSGPNDCIPYSGFNDGATDSGVPHSCANYQGGDVWFSFVAPSDGAVWVETLDAGGIADGGLAVYSGECDTLVEIGCSDDDGDGLFSLLQLTDLTPGEVYYAAVWEYGGNETGAFNICAYSPPTCPNPGEFSFFTDSISSNTAYVAWDVVNEGATYVIEYGPDGFTPGTGNTVTGLIGTDGPPVEIPGLDPSTAYDYYFQGACGVGDSTEVLGPYGFTTLVSCPSNSVFTIELDTAGFDFATISWIAYNPGATFYLEYGELGFEPGTGNTITGIVGIDGPPVTINGLFISTDYDLYLLEVCDVNDSTNFVGPFGFETRSLPPENDALCDAAEVIVNAPEVPFSNEGATAQVGEVAGSCWGGGPSIESAWMFFIAPPSGVATVTTDYPNTELHDTHIAVYSLDGDCEDLTGLTEVGCSEDEGDADPNGYTSVTVIDSLAPGEPYYIQVDGWNDQDGEFLIRVIEGLVGQSELASPAFDLYPNPTESVLNISSSEFNGQVTVDIIDINGRLVLTAIEVLNGDAPIVLDVNALSDGVYTVRITGDNSQSVRRLLVK